MPYDQRPRLKLVYYYLRFNGLSRDFEAEVIEFFENVVVLERNVCFQTAALHKGSTKTRLEGVNIPRDPERFTSQSTQVNG